MKPFAVSCTRIVTGLTLALFCATASQASAPPHWGYECGDGPADWCGLGPEFALCCSGVQQTPIDLSTCGATRATLPNLRFLYSRSSEIHVEHNGHTIQATVVNSDDATLRVGGVAYQLVQFHFHGRSEHWRDGEDYPLELHLVHRSAGGNLLVVGILVEEGPMHTELEKFWNPLPGMEGESVTVNDFDLTKLLPRNDGRTLRSFRYSGSLTTPPCTEGVQWVVLDERIKLSSGEIAEFHDLFSGEHFPDGNRRPLQPRKGRIVLTDLD